jgi:hypothetical protein
VKPSENRETYEEQRQRIDTGEGCYSQRIFSHPGFAFQETDVQLWLGSFGILEIDDVGVVRVYSEMSWRNISSSCTGVEVMETDVMAM